MKRAKGDFIQLDRFYEETKQSLKLYSEREKERQSTAGGYQLHPLHPSLSSHHPIHTTPNRLEMYVRICMKRIFFLSLSFRPLTVMIQLSLWSRIEKRREERGLNLLLPVSPSLFLSTLSLSTCSPLAQNCRVALCSSEMKPWVCACL